MMRPIGLLVGLAVLLGSASPALGQPEQRPSFGDLFGEGEGLVLTVRLDLEKSLVTAEQAEQYCREQLAGIGVPVLDKKSLRLADPSKIPTLLIRLKAGRDSDTPRWGSHMTVESHPYQYQCFVEYWDVAILKRMPEREGLLPIVRLSQGGFFTAEEYPNMVTWKNVRGSLDWALMMVQKSLTGAFQVEEGEMFKRVPY
jgi:hypothetical protein